MPRKKNDLNTIYISERLQEKLRPISRCALTTVVAPMGYGKTTAVNWYLNEWVKKDHGKVIRISIYTNNLPIFWKSVQNAFWFAGFDFFDEYECPSDPASVGLFADDLSHLLAGETDYYIFIDDFHLLTDARIAEFLCTLARRIPENVHLVVASRDRFLSGGAVVGLGGKLHQITVDHLRLNHTELSVYAHLCGTELSDRQIEALLHSSEGWFSAVYLNLCSFAERGELPDNHSDIYEMFSAAMIDPLPEMQREFLIVMGLADEFSAEMARFITENENTEQLLSSMTRQNAFVSRLTDGVTYRFHHMMKECAERAFGVMEKEKQTVYLDRYGKWYEEHKQYLHALDFYGKSGNFHGALGAIQKDAGVLLASLKADDVLSFLSKCPKDVLEAHPLSVLVLMRCMFNWRKIPEMLKIKDFLIHAIDRHTEISKEERGNLLGECDLITSFLMYNDISKMSHFHRSASRQMSRSAISIRNDGGWTFGSPSVLMMFHREPGELLKEQEEMNECMPHYYKITNGHGQGAERVMDAEALFVQGYFSDAQIALEGAYAQIEENGQECMALCCDFLSRRLSLCMDIKQRYSFEQRYMELMKHHNSMWINIFNSTSAYYHALTGQVDQIPQLFGEHKLSTVNFLAPGRPMMEMIENQVYLAQGAYAKVIGKSEGILEMCQGLHYALVALHVQIQTAAAYEKLGKHGEARSILKQALLEAGKDNIVMPFVENFTYMEPLFEGNLAEVEEGFLEKIRSLGKNYEEKCKKLGNEKTYPEEFKCLTEQELKLTELMAAHMSNKEIAARLYLSEGTIKQYINQIYSKLEITGDTRTKRKQLLDRFYTNN